MSNEYNVLGTLAAQIEALAVALPTLESNEGRALALAELQQLHRQYRNVEVVHTTATQLALPAHCPICGVRL